MKIKCLHYKYWQRGFSLVELSVVLVILSLLLSIIMVGSTLVQNAHINTIITEQYEHQNRIYKFYEMYNAVPGDFADAVLTFGCNSGKPCENGNNDRRIDHNMSTERFQIWRHLNLAGMISKMYSGAQVNNTKMSQVDINIPSSRFGDNLGYMVYYGTDTVSISQDVDSTSYNCMMLANYEQQNIFGFGESPALPSHILSMVDRKIDDGNPRSGNIVADLSDTMCYTTLAQVHSYTASKLPACKMLSILIGLPPINK